MEHTGERCIPGLKGQELVELEHRTRYAMAAERVEGLRVLDLGSGSGFGSGMLSDRAAFVLGVDISEEAVHYAENAYARPNTRFIQGDICAEDFVEKLRAVCPEPFDAATCFEVIEHVEKPLQLLRGVKELLKPGGLLLVSTPNVNYSFESDSVNKFHLVEYTQADFNASLSGLFKHVNTVGQAIRITSEIGGEAEEPRVLHEWRHAAQHLPKYWVAACSDDEAAAAPPQFGLFMSDGHLRFVQSRLKEIRMDQQIKSQRIQLLEARIHDLLELRAAAPRPAPVAPAPPPLPPEVQRNTEALERIEQRLQQMSEEISTRQNQLRRDFEGFKNHPAVRRLLRMRTPGLKLLGLFGLGFGSPGAKKKG